MLWESLLLMMVIVTVNGALDGIIVGFAMRAADGGVYGRRGRRESSPTER